MGVQNRQSLSNEWVSFPGGELEGKRPKALCRTCREELKQAAAAGDGSPSIRPRALCFQCYRADLDRARAVKAAGDLDTATAERFQSVLPLEPVNVQRLAMLKAERASARETARTGIGQYENRRRHAQISARHALQRIFAGVKARPAAATIDGERAIASAIHAAELQLPEAWLPFVVAR